MESIALQIFLAAVAIASVISLVAASVMNFRIKQLEKLVWELRSNGSTFGVEKTSSMADEFNSDMQ